MSFENTPHNPYKMIDIQDFDAVFPTGYTNELRQQIKINRKHLGGRTFFERLLDLLHIQGTISPALRETLTNNHTARKYYPPANTSDLKKLHERITTSSIAPHYQHALLFYLLKDLSPSHHDTSLSDASGREPATSFAESVHLEKRFWTFVEGLWDLDHLAFAPAVNALTHPSVIPTFPDEILAVLLANCDERKGRGVAGDEDMDELPLAYWTAVQPPLEDREVRIAFAKYFAVRNVSETLYWLRERPEYEQEELLQVLVHGTLEPPSFVIADEEEYTRADRAVELVGLPFTEEEEAVVERYLTEGKGRSLKGAQDTIMMRRIATGRLEQVVDSGVKARGAKHDGLDWDVLKRGVESGLGPRGDTASAFKI